MRSLKSAGSLLQALAALALIVAWAVAVTPSLRMLNDIPDWDGGVVRQTGVADCGTAALATFARQLGLDLSAPLGKVAVPSTGMTMLALRDTALSYGIPLRAVRVAGAGPTMLPGPWIAHFRSRLGHFVVVEQEREGYWVVADPARGRLRMSDSEFRSRWTGNALVLASSAPGLQVANWR